MHETTLVTREDVAEIVTKVGLDKLMDTMIDRLRAHFSEPRDDTLPVRAGFRHDERGAAGVLEWMPYNDGAGRVTIKTVSYNPANAARHGLPTILGTIAAYDVTTGRLLAITDGVFLTALRTGAASAVASSVLARPDSAVVGVVGAGAQAVTQLHALTRAFPIERVLVHDTDPDTLASFDQRIAFTGRRAEPVDLAYLESQADILVTATSVGIGDGPVITGRGIRPHAHINAVGSDLPGKKELPKALLDEALVCPDFRDQAVLEGECQQLAADRIGPELAGLVRRSGDYAPWRDRLTVFDSTGLASEDHVAVQALLELAEAQGTGRKVALEHIPEDARNPYHGLLDAGAPGDLSGQPGLAASV